ncbi:MAG: oligosaccharide flippase family protein [Planctomycetota bacterium]
MVFFRLAGGGKHRGFARPAVAAPYGGRRVAKSAGIAAPARGSLSLDGEVIGSFLARVLGLVLQFATAIVLARVLDPAGYGVYAYALAIAGLLTIPIQWGLPTLIVREAAALRLADNWSLLRGLVIRAHEFMLGTAVLIMLLGWFVTSRTSLFSEPERSSAVFVGLLLAALVALLGLGTGLLRGLRLTAQSQLIEHAVRPGLFLAIIALLAWTLPLAALSPVRVVAALSAATGVAYLACLWLYRRTVPAPVRSWAPTYTTQAWFRSAGPMALTSGLFVVNTQTDVVLLGFLCSDADVGCYRVAVQLASLLLFLLVLWNAVVAARFAQLHAARDRHQLQELVSLSSLVVTTWAVGVYLLFAVAGRPLITALFGPEYQGAYVPLLILGAGQLVNAAAGPVGLLLTMTGHEQETLKGVAAAAIANIVLNLMLIPWFGIHGAATAAALSLVIWNVLLWRSVRRHLAIETFRWRAAVQTFVGSLAVFQQGRYHEGGAP